jgi:hypothetical protein
MPRTQHFQTRDLDQHVALIKRQLDKSMQDGAVRQLAVQIVSGTNDHATDPRTGDTVPIIRAFGRQFLAPPGAPCRQRDEACEIERIWDFVVLNFRYVYDPAEIDTFATARESLLAGGGDCDDSTILIAALAGFVGFRAVARVISTQDNPKTWVHIYPLIGISKDDPKQWIPLDVTVEGAAPGWEYESIANYRDYPMV